MLTSITATENISLITENEKNYENYVKELNSTNRFLTFDLSPGLYSYSSFITTRLNVEILYRFYQDLELVEKQTNWNFNLLLEKHIQPLQEIFLIFDFLLPEYGRHYEKKPIVLGTKCSYKILQDLLVYDSLAHENLPNLSYEIYEHLLRTFKYAVKNNGWVSFFIYQK